MATAAAATDMVLAATTVAARAAPPDLTAVEINVAASRGATENLSRLETDLMGQTRLVIAIAKETASVIGTAAAGATEGKTTTAHGKDTMTVTDTMIHGASEDTDTNHSLLIEASWFVGGYHILQFPATSPPPFDAEGKHSTTTAAMLLAASHGTWPATARATAPLECRILLTRARHTPPPWTMQSRPAAASARL
jgi:hypothetical protein